uniref:SMC family ATPase n=3 Tax=Staphylothermus marinus TaxID=2280 RepID=A0A7C4HES0_STAMA
MIILGVRLKNIRSYRDQTIVFPMSGVTTIYGDIGTGKTTILNSISFALFGRQTLSKDPVEGYAYPKPDYLLRRGANSGFVKVLIAHGDKLIVVRRDIEKRGETYSSTSGEIQVYEFENNKFVLKTRKQCSHDDLRIEVLKELGFKEKISKMKPIVFTNTIYTPQFNIDKILVLDKEDRELLINYSLGLERYHCVKENVKELNSILERQKKEKEIEESMKLKQLGGKSPEDRLKEIVSERKELERKKREIEETKTKLEERMREIEKELSRIREEKGSVSREIVWIENLKRELESLKKEYSLKKTNLRELGEKLGIVVLEDLKKLQKEVEDRLELIGSDLSRVENELDEISRRESELSDLKYRYDSNLLKLRGELGERRGRITSKSQELEKYEEELSRIKKLVSEGVCPVCKQKILHEHGERLVREMEEKIREIEKEINELNVECSELSREMSSIEDELERVNSDLNKLRKNREILSKRKDELMNTKLKLVELNNIVIELINLENEIASKESRVRESSDLINKLNKLIEEEEKYERFKYELGKQIDELTRELGGVENRLDSLEKEIESVKIIAEELEKIRTEIDRYEKMRNFLDRFVKIVNQVEVIVRSIALDKFREMFRLFLNKLMEEQEVIEADVRDDFTVSVKARVDGRLQDILQPSGGQLMATSLAYRLALNSVVRSLNPVLADSSLLLDEPTIGFSPERVDKLRKLFQELSSSFGQVILVTHDSKLLEIGDCRIKLTIDTDKTLTSIDYEECTDISGEISFSEYKRFVEELLSDRITAIDKTILETNNFFKPIVIKRK